MLSRSLNVILKDQKQDFFDIKHFVGFRFFYKFFLKAFNATFLQNLCYI